MFNFGINHFRSFLNEEFEFSKINIMIGENNGGKSSLLKFLTALKQSLKDPLELNLKFSGDFIDLGNFKQSIYYNDLEKNISFSFKFGSEYKKYFDTFFPQLKPDFSTPQSIYLTELDKIIGDNFDVTVKIDCNQHLNDHSSLNISITNVSIGKLEIKAIDKDLCNLIFTDKNSEISTLENISYEKRAFLTYVKSRHLIDLCADDPKLEILFYKLAYLLVAQNYIEHVIDDFQYINPLNFKPERFYVKKDPKRTLSFQNLDELVNTFNYLPSDTPKVFSKILKDFGIVDEIRLITDERLPVIELQAKVGGLWSNILDVGYGASLQIPILFTAFVSHAFNTENTLIIEQPEVHLHPFLQAKFIESLIKLDNNNYFIETHSEHIIRMLQIMVKEKRYGLTSKDVVIHYMKREKDRFKRTTHHIDESGRLDNNFPEGFYDVSYKLAKGLLL